MTRTFFTLCLVAAQGLSCGQTAAPPETLFGNFVDDYGIEYSITPSLWMQGASTRYHIIEWDVEGQSALARNDDDNPSEAGLWTRIDWVPLDDPEFKWAFCYSAYSAGSMDEARAAPEAMRGTPRTGCNGFPFSRMKRVPTP